MAFWKASLPVTPEQQHWVDSSMWRLVYLFDRERLLTAKVVLPTPEFFPDPYDNSEASAQRVLSRVCGYLGVDEHRVDLEIFSDASDDLRAAAPAWGVQSGVDPAGLYVGGWRQSVEIRSSLLDEPVALIATMAHELCHVLLLGDGLVKPDEPNMEPFTDLATVFLGFGVCSGNACVRFRQWDGGGRHGWQAACLGYLGEEVYGYALAVFAQMRGERKPVWAKHLDTNVRSYFSRSEKVLSQRGTH